MQRRAFVVAALGVTIGALALGALQDRDLYLEAGHLFASTRPFTALLSGSTGRNPCERSPGATVTTRCIAAPRSDAMIEAAMKLIARTQRTADDRGDAALARALIDVATSNGDPAVLDDAVRRIERVIAAGRRDAKAYNDLAVARLELSAQRNDALGLFDALDAIESAYALDSQSTVVAFNRALILDRAHLFECARRAWQQIAQRAEPGLAAEARERLAVIHSGEAATPPDSARLASASVAYWDSLSVRSPQIAREAVLDLILPGWGRSVVAGDTATARRLLDGAVRVAQAIARRTGDSSVAHVVQDVSSAAVRRQAIADGLASMDRGAEAFRRTDYKDASRELLRAGRGLRSAGASYVNRWADLLRGATFLYQANYATTDSVYEEASTHARRTHDMAREARARWGLALSAFRQGRAEVARDEYGAAGIIFERIGERANQAAMLSQRADVLFLLGQDAEAMRGKSRALMLLANDRKPDVRHGLLLDLGRQLTELGLASAGIIVLEEAVLGSAVTGRAKDLPEALTRLSRAEVAAGREAIARLHVDQAAAALPTVRDSLIMRPRLRMEIDHAAAIVAERSEPEVALARFGAVLAFYDTLPSGIGRPAVLVKRARLAMQRGDLDAALQDLEAATADLDRHRPSRLRRSEERDYAAARRDVEHQLVELAVRQRDDDKAFAHAERARTGKPAIVAPARLDDATTVLAYSVLQETTLLWVVTASGRQRFNLSVSANRLSELSTLLERALRARDTAAAQTLGRTLYEILIAQAARLQRRHVVIVPDGPIARIPFAALIDNAGHYLIESASIAYARSSLSEHGVDSGTWERSTHAVIVGNPRFDRSMFPDLQLLSAAGAEAESIRAMYREPTMLADTAATKRAVFGALARARLFHFAGHARQVGSTPSSSHLVLSATTGGFGQNTLTADEISSLQLSNLSLVVLSACGTAQARSRRDDTEGGLAAAFLDAGAGAVVSSLWEADDGATAALMREFHEALFRSPNVADALRAAQITRLRAAGGAGPSTWAAFRLQIR